MAAESARARRPPPVELPERGENEKVKVALCQILVTDDKQRNISHARRAIESAADEGAKLIMLPEIWNSPYSNDSFGPYSEFIEEKNLSLSPSASMLSEVAREKKVTVIGGSIPERRKKEGSENPEEIELFNTCCVFGTKGEILGKFSKLHLFDIDIPGEIFFKESLTLTKGQKPLVVDTEVGRIGIGICFDIRFPELALLYAARGVHMICYPGAFNLTTGPLHWELLQRARAVDNQVYVLTCAPSRNPLSSYQAWGHSTVVGPFGEVLATTGHEECTVFAEIDFSLILKRRRNLTLAEQRRGDLYELLDLERAKEI